MSGHVLDMGQLPPGTEMECCISPGFSAGCQDTAYIDVSSDGATWSPVASFDTTSKKKDGGGWEPICTTVTPEGSFQYVRGGNDKCYVDHFKCSVPCGVSEQQAATVQQLPVTADTWLEGGAPNGSHKHLIVGKHSSFPKKRALLKADVSTVPPGSVVSQATLWLYFDYAHAASFIPESCIDRVIGAHPVLVAWDEAAATKNNATEATQWAEPLCGTNDVDAAQVPHTTDEWLCTEIKSWKSFDVTGLAQQWVDDPSSNHGVLLRAENEDDAGRDMRIYSRDSSDSALHPYLEIGY